MINKITREQLPKCLDILTKSYEDSAVTFGMTEENCPYRGRTRLPLQELEKEFDNGYTMYGYVTENHIIGFLSMKADAGELSIQDLAILPDYQGKGFGTALISFAKKTAKQANCKAISLGMVHDNISLREWYQKQGFKSIKLLQFEKVSYTVGIMELIL